MAKPDWATCERCAARTPAPYYVLARDPAAPCGWSNITLCAGCGRDALRIPHTARTREALVAAAVPA